MTANDTAHGLDGLAAATKQLGHMVQQQAYLMSFIDVFLLLTLLFGGLGVSAMLMKKPSQAGGGGGGH